LRRIGQTRDVHIYRLITEQTIEENILLKAKQKKQLDFLVMDEGNFTGASDNATGKQPEAETGEKTQAPVAKVGDVFSKGGLRDLLGVSAVLDDGSESDSESIGDSGDSNADHAVVNGSNIEEAMAAVEDEADITAMRGAQKEAVDELQEFDETIQYEKDDEGHDTQESQDEGASTKDNVEASETSPNKKKRKSPSNSHKTIVSKGEISTAEDDASVQDDSTVDTTDAEAEQKEFEAWQSSAGIDMKSLEASLKPVERYALHFKEEIDPYYSNHVLMDLQKMGESELAGEQEIDLKEIERTKAAEEQRAVEKGELLATQPSPEALPRQRHLYIREKSRLQSEKKRRKLLGKNWVARTDAVNKFPFWYNEDTGEATWDRPNILIELEAETLARKKGWNLFPFKPLLEIMKFLNPSPDRTRCSAVCRQWRWAAGDFSFVKHVWPVEMGALSMDKSRLDSNHYVTIQDALDDALPGDTIELGDGHYWVKSPGLHIKHPIKFLGDENDPSHVVIELSGSIQWTGKGGWVEGVTVRRTKNNSGNDEKLALDMFTVADEGHFNMAHCVFDNSAGSGGHTARLSTATSYKECAWKSVTFKGAAEEYVGLAVEGKSSLRLQNVRVYHPARFESPCRVMYCLPRSFQTNCVCTFSLRLFRTV
jgi:hypothetical protein